MKKKDFFSKTNGGSKKTATAKSERIKKERRAVKSSSNFNKPPKQTAIGKVEMTMRGSAFLICENFNADPFIKSDDLKGAKHGDKVEVQLISFRRKGGEWEVKKILERGFTKVVGTFFDNKQGGYIVPDEVKLDPKIFIDKNKSLSANNADKVVVEIDYNKVKNANSTLSGAIVEVLGAIDDPGVDILSIIRSHRLYEEFPKAVVDESKKIALPPNQNNKLNRTDFTKDVIFTIDGDDSKDFDDAVSIKILDNGNYKLGVHIADVSHYVVENSKLDKEAFKRGTSVYFVDRVLPMLPEILSNDICSLNENVERLTLSCIMEIDNTGKIDGYQICNGVIKSVARLTYSNVTKVLEGNNEVDDKYKKLLKELKLLKKLALILNEKRTARGNIDFDLDESQVVLDENKRVIDIVKKPRLLAHRIIEECMLAANETVARFLKKIKAPGVFRVHEPPPTDKFESLQDMIKALAVDFSFKLEMPTPREFNLLLETVKDSNYNKAITKTALRTMSKAAYAPSDDGHFGLASENYCHFTSPIRRYPDLCVHRIVKYFLANGAENLLKFKEFTDKASSQSSERERLAEKAEREVLELKKAEYMQDKIGNCYTGYISGVTDFGVFVELDNTVEGLIRVQNLPGDNYELISRQMLLTNKISFFRIGDKLDIQVAAVMGSKIEFELCDCR